MIFQDVSNGSAGWTSGITYSGHVAVVTATDASNVYVFQQNFDWAAAPDTYYYMSLPLTQTSNGWHVTPQHVGSNRITRGWIHFTANNGTHSNPNLYMVKRTATGSNSTEIFVLSSASQFASFVTQTGTPLQQTGSDASWQFLVGDYNGDGIPDIYAIAKANTGSGKVEVHILDGATNYQTWLAHIVTAQPVVGTDETYMFALGSYNADGKLDLWMIKRANTGSNSTEVHIMSATSNFSSFIEHTGTALQMTGSDSSWAFLVGDYNHDGKADLYTIQKTNTGTGTTEVHVLDGSNRFQTFLLHTGTALQQTGSDDSIAFALADYNGDGQPDLYAIAKANTTSGKTEVHVLNGASTFSTFLTHLATAVATTGTDLSYEFAVPAWP